MIKHCLLIMQLISKIKLFYFMQEYSSSLSYCKSSKKA